MCDEATPKEEQVKCGRCGRVVNPSTSWTHGWPLHGHITLGMHSCSSDHLEGRWVLDEVKPDRRPGCMTRYTPQGVDFVWGESTRYRLCGRCQGLLLELVGWFFGMRDGDLSTVRIEKKGDEEMGEGTAVPMQFVQPGVGRKLSKKTTTVVPERCLECPCGAAIGSEVYCGVYHQTVSDASAIGKPSHCNVESVTVEEFV